MVEASLQQIVYVGNSGDQTISVLELRADGRLVARGTIEIQPRVPSGRSIVMTVSPDKAFLYAGFTDAAARPLVATFSLVSDSGLPVLMGSTPVADSVAYIATDRQGKFLLGASYAGDKVMVSRIGANGTVGETWQVIPTESKAHCIVTDPTNRFVLHTSLGADLIYQPHFDAYSGTLSPNDPPSIRVRAQAGPRFICFASDARIVYVLNELDASIDLHPYDGSRGMLGPSVQTVSLLPPGFSGKPWGADIHLSPDGRHLYASERTSSTLAHFGIDAASGRLARVGFHSTVKQPRAFQIDRTGRWLVSSGQLANGVAVHAIDPVTGVLTLREEYPVGTNPTWVEIVSRP
jgi:6-phosphogluconolactonase